MTRKIAWVSLFKPSHNLSYPSKRMTSKRPKNRAFSPSTTAVFKDFPVLLGPSCGAATVSSRSPAWGSRCSQQ